MKKFLVSSLAVLFSVCLMAQNNVNLKMNLEKNKIYRMNATGSQTILQTINGNQQTVDSKTSTTISVKMVDATADFMITEIRFDTVIYNTNAMGKTTIISSANEGNMKSTESSDVLSCIMNRLSKNALYAKMDFSGKVLEIVNVKMLSDLIMKDTSTIVLTGPMASGVKTQLKSMVSEKALKTMIETFTHNLPAKQVSKGDKWNVTANINSGGMSLDIITDYQLDGIAENSANVSAESEIKTALNADPILAGGAKITYDDIKGLNKANLVLDTKTGLIVEEKSKSHIAGNMAISGPGFSMQIPLDINGESKVTALK